ncbi:MAG: transposase [Caldilineaceae bacterium SB0665_bin_21]|nr:transposase [Caldilineaceae bacterium SB0665_bin_21]MYC62156.1 transposase [Caldilineaceae bacterium SB0661_bin_34]
MAFTPTNGRNTIRVGGNRVRIPAIGWVRMTEPLCFAGDILSATVSLEADRWFIALQVDTGEPEPPRRPGPTVGIDMGIQVLATLWDGDERTKILNPRPLQEALAELRRIDQAISRSLKVPGKHRTSHRREALYARRRRQHARVSHLRNDHHHRTTTAIAKRGDTVKVESLHIAGMQRNRRLGRAFGDAGLGEFVRQLGVQVRLVRHRVPAH